jgi:hypothetical protein
MKLFETSSDIALKVLSFINQAHERRLGISFAMMLAGLSGAGLSEQSIADFLAAYCRFWSRYLPEDIATAWSSGLEERQQTLLPRAEAILSDRASPGSQINDALSQWKSAVHIATETLDRQASDILPGVVMPGPDASLEQRRDFLLLNYTHTHNNRLGVVPAHEAYLAYLAHHAVCRLAGFAPRTEAHTNRDLSERELVSKV